MSELRAAVAETLRLAYLGLPRADAHEHAADAVIARFGIKDGDEQVASDG